MAYELSRNFSFISTASEEKNMPQETFFYTSIKIVIECNHARKKEAAFNVYFTVMINQ